MSKAAFLIVKMSALGDILLSLNVAKYLKKKFPECIVHWVVETKFQELVRSCPYVDETLSLDMKLWKCAPLKFLSSLRVVRRQQYDEIFDLQGNCKSAVVTLFAKGTQKVGWGKKSVAEWPNLLVTGQKIDLPSSLPQAEQYLALVQKYFHETSQREYEPHLLKSINSTISLDHTGIKIMVCPGSHWWSKQLPEETWSAFLNQINAKYTPLWVFIWGTEQEKALAQRLSAIFPCSQVLGALPFPLWQALMLQMQYVISVDSCALHLAGLSGVPSLSIFGPSSSHMYKPSGKIHISHQGTCPYEQEFVKRCPYLRTCSTAACVKNIPPEMLMERFEELVLRA